MRPIIEFCMSNMYHGTDKVMQRLEENPEYDVVEYGCLGHCGECFYSPYALVNGEFVSGDTAEELYNRIMEKIKELEEMSDLLDI